MLPVVCLCLIQKLLLTAAIHDLRQRRKIVANSERLWPLPIYFRIASEVDRKLVEQGLSQWERVTCVTFTEAVNEQQRFSANNILNFVDNNGCYSNIGYASAGHRFISLSPSCATLGVLIHEIGHALGLWHEQNRIDRDKYINIHYESIQPEWITDFAIKYWLTDFGVPYDYGSIMHYSPEAFAKDGHHTITPVDINYEQTLGQRETISFYDAALINRAYCSDKCERVNIVVPTCQNGGYVDARSCKSCLCPTGFTGASCQSVLTGPSCPTPHLQATAQWKELTWSGQDKCAWSIQAEQQQRIEVLLNDLQMQVEDSTACSSEYVELKYYSDIAISGARFCHHGTERAVISETNRVMVIYYGHGGSFKLSYKLTSHKAHADRL